MNRKVLLTMILWVMAAFMPAMAQSSLTVYDGENINQYVPIYGYYCDSYLKCEFVIPATDLADLNGQQINELTWYLNTKPTKAWGNFTVFIKEVAETTISEYSGLENATVVYEGAIDATGDNFVIEFQAPYVYNGGNLLIGVYHEKGAYSASAFYGTNVTGACVQGNNYSSLDDVSATQRNFIPKTTFAYSPAGSPVYNKPKNLAVSNIGPNEATLTWEAGGTETAWNVEYKKTTDTEWTSAGTVNATTCKLDALANGYDYEARVQGNYGDGVSNWVNIPFSTPLCDEEDQGEITYTLGDHYADTWNGAAIQVISVTTGAVIETITMPTGKLSLTGTLPLCYGETYNFVWVSGSYDSECSFTFTDPEGNVLITHEEDEEFTDFNLLSYTMAMPVPPATEYSEFYLVGTFSDPAWSQAEDARIEFTDHADEGTEYYTIVNLKAGDQFKIITFDKDGEIIWIGAQSDGNFLIKPEYYGSTYITLILGPEGENFEVQDGGTYKISIIPAPVEEPAEPSGIAPKAVTEPFVMVIDKQTGITDINVNKAGAKDWYNLNGQKLNGQPTAPGIYINGNRKVVIK